MPIEPVSMAASSERMSPNMFSVTITSKWVGAETSCMAALSTSTCSSSTWENSLACSSLTTWRHSLEVSSTLALSTLVTFGLAERRSAAIEGGARDPLDLLGAVGAHVRGDGGGARLLAEVDAAGELAHDQQVGALDALASQRRGVVERRQRLDGAQVRVQPEPLAQPEQPLLGTRLVGVGGVPLRAADRREQHRVGAPCRRPGPRR